MNIKDILSQRTDLSTFLVHLTRSTLDMTASEHLRSIFRDRFLKAISPMGHAYRKLQAKSLPTTSQNVVCFTETPLQQITSLLGPIENRQMQFEPYGIAITKKQGRRIGANPVWYVDQTEGHHWLTNEVDSLVEGTIHSDPLGFDYMPIAKLAPFIEQMGTWPSTGNRKEFWWEREWRFLGNFTLPEQLIGLCPEAEIEQFKTLNEYTRKLPFVDPRWSLEEMIASLAGFNLDKVRVFE